VTGRCDEVLVAYGLGSCVGVTAFDPVARVAGMAHVVLPASGEASVNGSGAKFADKAVPALVGQLESRGAKRHRLIFKLAGGSQVLKIAGLDDRMRVGERNIAAVKSTLAGLGLIARAEDLGGNRGRTMHFYTDTGRVTVRTIGEAERDL
ncbi:MAG: chemotaxis protein CheD, partial [Chloroflexota bacterium]